MRTSLWAVVSPKRKPTDKADLWVIKVIYTYGYKHYKGRYRPKILWVVSAKNGRRFSTVLWPLCNTREEARKVKKKFYNKHKQKLGNDLKYALWGDPSGGGYYL